MTKWKCMNCGATVKAAEEPAHCPKGHTDIEKVREGPVEWLMHKLNYQA